MQIVIILTVMELILGKILEQNSILNANNLVFCTAIILINSFAFLLYVEKNIKENNIDYLDVFYF